MDLREIPKAFDKAYVDSFKSGSEALNESITDTREKLLRQYSNDSLANRAIKRCDLDRRLVGSIKLGVDWEICLALYRERKGHGFDSPVDHCMTFQILLMRVIEDKIAPPEEILETCSKLKKELDDLKQGCIGCLTQLEEQTQQIE